MTFALQIVLPGPRTSVIGVGWCAIFEGHGASVWQNDVCAFGAGGVLDSGRSFP